MLLELLLCRRAFSFIACQNKFHCIPLRIVLNLKFNNFGMLVVTAAIGGGSVELYYAKRVSGAWASVVSWLPSVCGEEIPSRQR